MCSQKQLLGFADLKQCLLTGKKVYGQQMRSAQQKHRLLKVKRSLFLVIETNETLIILEILSRHQYRTVSV